MKVQTAVIAAAHQEKTTRDSPIGKSPLGRILVKTDTSPAQARATLAQRAAFLTTSTIQTTVDAKPLLRKLNIDPKARGAYKEERSYETLQPAAQKAELTPYAIEKLTSEKYKAETTHGAK